MPHPAVSRRRPAGALRRAALLPIGLVAALATACVARPIETTDGPPAPFLLTIDSVTQGTWVGSAIPLNARLQVSTPDVAPLDARVTWATSDASIGWITNDGILILEKPGELTVTATAGIVSARRRFTVARAEVERVTMRPSAAVGRPGEPVELGAAATTKRDGATGDVGLMYGIGIRGRADRTGRIDAGGRFIADRPGSYALIAAFGDAGAMTHLPVGTAPLRTADVLLAGGGDDDDGVLVGGTSVRDVSIDRVGDHEPYAGTSVPFTARVRMNGGGTAAPAVTWSSSDPGIAWVDATGLVHFVRRGRVVIAATAGGVRETREIDVRDPQAARMQLRSTSASGRAAPRVGERLQLRTDAWTLGGSPLRGLRAEYGVWSGSRTVTAPQVTIDETEGFVATAPGTYVVLSTVSGLASSLVVTVVP